MLKLPLFTWSTKCLGTVRTSQNPLWCIPVVPKPLMHHFFCKNLASGGEFLLEAEVLYHPSTYEESQPWSGLLWPAYIHRAVKPAQRQQNPIHSTLPSSTPQRSPPPLFAGFIAWSYSLHLQKRGWERENEVRKHWSKTGPVISTSPYVITPCATPPLQNTDTGEHIITPTLRFLSRKTGLST